MYSDEWTESLRYLYCRTPHYLLPINTKDTTCQISNYGKTEGCEWIGDYRPFQGYDNQVFRVEIVYLKTTREIQDFHVHRECVEDSSHYGDRSTERCISSENKSSFYSIFRPLISKKIPLQSDSSKDQ